MSISYYCNNKKAKMNKERYVGMLTPNFVADSHNGAESGIRPAYTACA